MQWVDRQEYPFESKYLDLPMGRMHFVEEGAGLPILFVHGLPTWSFLWRKLIRGLSSNFTCVAPDHIGFGLSDKPPGWTYAPRAHAENLASFIEDRGLAEMTLVVHDFGGPIGLSYALDFPQDVERIIVFNSWMWSLRGDAQYEAAARFVNSALGRFLYLKMNFSARVMMKKAFGDPSLLTPQLHRQYTERFPTPESRMGCYKLAQQLVASSPWYDELYRKREILRDKPALILWGMRDPAFPPRHLTKWQEILPNAQVVRYPGAGHFVQEEVGPELVQVIARFLSGK